MALRKGNDMAMSDNAKALPRDITRFQKFRSNGRAVIPDNAPEQFAALTTRDLIAISSAKK